MKESPTRAKLRLLDKSFSNPLIRKNPCDPWRFPVRFRTLNADPEHTFNPDALVS